jgi:hypothetical protein
LVPEAELVDWLMRTTVVLVALAAAVPMLASVQFTERLAPGATGFGLTTMLCGIRSELVAAACETASSENRAEKARA